MGFTGNLEGCVWGGGSAGPSLRSLRRLWEGIFRAARGAFRMFVSKAPFGSVPLPLSRYE